jgi:hypothetical protein
MCFCTGMLYDPAEKQKSKWDFVTKSKIYSRWLAFKNSKLLKAFTKDPVKVLSPFFRIS